MASMSPPEAFTQQGTQAFSPVVAGTEDRRFLVAWRDQNNKGRCWMRAAAMGTTSVRGAEQHLQWGEPVNFCRTQSHKMAVLPAPGNRVIVLFADQVKGSMGSPPEKFGNSVLLDVSNSGAITSLGNFRLTD